MKGERRIMSLNRWGIKLAMTAVALAIVAMVAIAPATVRAQSVLRLVPAPSEGT